MPCIISKAEVAIAIVSKTFHDCTSVVTDVVTAERAVTDRQIFQTFRSVNRG